MLKCARYYLPKAKAEYNTRNETLPITGGKYVQSPGTKAHYYWGRKDASSNDQITTLNQDK